MTHVLLLQLQYKTERDGIVETRVEQKITIQSDGDPIDHDKALAEAIQVSIRRFPSIFLFQIHFLPNEIHVRN